MKFPTASDLNCDHCDGCEFCSIDSQGIGSYEYWGHVINDDGDYQVICEHPENENGNPDKCPKGKES